MIDNQHSIQEPANLRFLRRLITGLTATMIIGIATIVVLLVLRLSGAEPVPLPTEITLPEGQTATAVTYGPDWYAVVTQSAQILIFDRNTGALRQQIQITPAPQ
ncbi:DUF6476 family protein [Pseudoruegeria sp. SK021]|uniref:DUF6476 family protein n=1 Tax=Pseudoruegeria sp. SK021 TaxID=1933035 RepID=UPI000A22FDBA|nr:DUF6476 family protein [Pseudoruegeria sp. SK021]OSP56834.1 hypothetical protein BV911_00040 [Pseudoruegeria sp. SK021]